MTDELRPTTAADLRQVRENITRELNHLTLLVTEGMMPGDALEAVNDARASLDEIIAALAGAEEICRRRKVVRVL